MQLAKFEVEGKTYEIYGEVEICVGKDYRLKEYSYPEFSDLTAKIIEGDKSLDFVPTGVRWCGTKYTVEDMITDLLFKSIVGNKEYSISYLDETLKKLVADYQNEKIVLEDLELPFRILDQHMYGVLELTLVTNEYVYYGCDDEMIMLDVEELAIISDNYFAGVGYDDSCENIKNGKEKLLWAYEGFGDDN